MGRETQQMYGKSLARPNKVRAVFYQAADDPIYHYSRIEPRPALSYASECVHLLGYILL